MFTRFSAHEKCRNHYCYRVLSLHCKFASKMGFEKEGRKSRRRTRSVKRTPPRGRKLTLGCFAVKKTGKYTVFRVCCFQISVHFTLVGCFFRGSPKNILKVLWNSQEVAKKLVKTRVICGFLVSGFIFLFRLLMVTCRLHIPCYK